MTTSAALSRCAAAIRSSPNFLQNPLGTVTRRVSDNNITWDASATYAATDDVNLYARVARGYRAPSIQGRILFPPATATPLESGVTIGDSETITSYESGIKSTFLDGRARFNVNGFYYELKNAQLTAVGGGVNANRLINADKVRGYGFEADLEFKPVPELLLTAGVSYNNTQHPRCWPDHSGLRGRPRRYLPERVALHAA